MALTIHQIDQLNVLVYEIILPDLSTLSEDFDIEKGEEEEFKKKALEYLISRLQNQVKILSINEL